jgi:hypothetical protein
MNEALAAWQENTRRIINADLSRCSQSERALLEAGCQPTDFSLTEYSNIASSVSTITHMPTGLVGSCGDHMSVFANRAEAMNRLAELFFASDLAKPKLS